MNVEHLLKTSLKERFAAVYTNHVWTDDGKGALSGWGSELRATDVIRQSIPEVLRRLGTRTLLDIGCGDFTWMKEAHLPCGYIGVDIVPDLIEHNSAQHGSEARVFQALDATCDPLPAADTILCRDVLFHLSFADIWRVIENVVDSRATFLIATTNTKIRVNADIISGDFRRLNLQIRPFCFPRPETVILDNIIASDRVLGLWKISELPRRRERRA
jgi:2-polyprenyl-3-methyl-5-hydroxy-6-metoxy-1,4-benzoquinol methylase